MRLDIGSGCREDEEGSPGEKVQTVLEYEMKMMSRAMVAEMAKVSWTVVSKSNKIFKKNTS